MTQQPTDLAFPAPTRTRLIGAVLAMAAVVLASNILVQYPINDWLTWGAISYPVAFLVSDLINRGHGPEPARRVAWVGFAVAVAASLLLAPARIAIASGTAFIVSQCLDIAIFHRLRQGTWWRAPLVATVLAAALDTAIFWSIAFAGSADPWITWALGDLGVKLAVGVLLLLPFRLLTWRGAGRPAHH
ncbi:MULTISPECIES: queuosine precursor transporter [unclassified Acidovorax]|uniref:queuosine precursor transporter n=1 Tax=unclassified Acidovorax TaxID=2684926 RepID=UPI0038574D16